MIKGSSVSKQTFVGLVACAAAFVLHEDFIFEILINIIMTNFLAMLHSVIFLLNYILQSYMLATYYTNYSFI